MGVYEELGVKHVVNAWASMTYIGGSRMPRQVVEAWVEAAKSFVDMHELHRATGKAIAKLMGVDMGLVTAGGAAAQVTAIAACIVKRNTITDPDEMRKKLPHSEGLVNEILMPMSHRNVYNQAFEVGGGRIVEFGAGTGFTDQDLENAITDRTVAVGFVLRLGQKTRSQGLDDLKRACEIAHRHDLPVIVDAAAQVPPRQNFKAIVETGVDLICFSGGKAIMGPNDTGFLFGRGDLMEIAHANLTCPNHQVVRAMKAGKEDIVAAVKALELYVSADEGAENNLWERRVRYWMDYLSDVPHVKVERLMPDPNRWSAPVWPKARVTIDEQALHTTAWQVVEALREGDPRIYVPGGEDGSASFNLNPWHLTDEEVEIVARRVKEVLLAPPPAKSRPAPPSREVW